MKSLYTLGLFLLIASTSCNNKVDNGYNSLIDIVPEPIGSNCNNGGYKIMSGLDINRNDELDMDEIQNEEFLCNGEIGSNGYNSLVDLIPEPIGENCSNGGYKIVTGIDINANNVLDTEEILKEEFICNGEIGNNGQNSLVQVIPEEGNENCTNGGYLINTGLDLNADNILSEDEIQSSVYICNGLNGATDIQIRLSLLTIIGQNNMGNMGTSSGFFIGTLEKFNKNYWPGIDSIVFVTNLQTANSVSFASADLFDSSNNSIITHSTVSTNSTSPTKLVSDNIYNDLPDGEIDLTIQLRSESIQYQSFISGKSYLLLYRSE